ncbi:hypothetical protein LTR17_021313 [Elasticomyces elasticus]|nr:hypothetical protein LTR17_021313 [Elasticomyces elasticus]
MASVYNANRQDAFRCNNPPPADDYYVAMWTRYHPVPVGHSQDAPRNCNSTLMVRNPKLNTSALAMVIDRCASCVGAGHQTSDPTTPDTTVNGATIDLSENLWRYLFNNAEGSVYNIEYDGDIYGGSLDGAPDVLSAPYSLHYRSWEELCTKVASKNMRSTQCKRDWFLADAMFGLYGTSTVELGLTQTILPMEECSTNAAIFKDRYLMGPRSEGATDAMIPAHGYHYGQLREERLWKPWRQYGNMCKRWIGPSINKGEIVERKLDLLQSSQSKHRILEKTGDRLKRSEKSNELWQKSELDIPVMVALHENPTIAIRLNETLTISMHTVGKKY